jgi:hypothetical protein
MRNRTLALVVGLALAMISASSVLADTSPGGNADLGLDAITISAGSVVGKTGEVTLTGAIECSQDLTADVFVDISQVVGRFNTIRGFGYASVSCLAADGSAPFTMSLFADQGKFAGGSARLSAFAETGSCDDVECFFDSVSYGPATLRLKGATH